MSHPISDLEFDDAIDRSWSRFRDALVARVAALSDGGMIAYVSENADSEPTHPDLSFRYLHDGAVCAVIAIDAADPTLSVPGWSVSGPRHLVRVASTDAIGTLVDSSLTVARARWGTTHPSFLRPLPDAVAARPDARAAAMGDHPAGGGVGRAVRRVVEQYVSEEVGVSGYQVLELAYAEATVHLQIWEAERSALLWTTITGVTDPDRLDLVRDLGSKWPGFRLVLEGSVVDVELATDLGDRPARSMRVAIEQWDAFMRTAYPALVEALTHPDGGHGADVSAPLRAVLRAHRDGHPVTAAQTRALLRADRAELLTALDVCRRRSVSWMAWADRRSIAGDHDGSVLACAEAQMWDVAFATVSEALRGVVSTGDR